MFVARLLAILVTGSQEDRRAVLHESVLLRQADGTSCQGREQVLARLARRSESKYRLVDAGPDTIDVMLTLADVPGGVRFSMRGEAIDDRLIAVHVEV